MIVDRSWSIWLLLAVLLGIGWGEAWARDAVLGQPGFQAGLMIGCTLCAMAVALGRAGWSRWCYAVGAVVVVIWYALTVLAPERGMIGQVVIPMVLAVGRGAVHRRGAHGLGMVGVQTGTLVLVAAPMSIYVGFMLRVLVTGDGP